MIITAAMDSTEYGLVYLHQSLTTPYSVLFCSYWSSSTWRSTLNPVHFSCSGYEDPFPPYRVIDDCVCSLITAVQQSLRLGVNLNCKFSVDFRKDIFMYLFKGKGSTPPSGQGKFYDLDDFNTQFFPVHWYRVFDSLGDGCEVQFPIRLLSKVKWSRKVYKKQEDGTLAIVPPTFTEVLNVTLVKRCCQ